MVSKARFMSTKKAPLMITIHSIIGKSRSRIDLTKRLPMAGMENMISTMKAPVRSIGRILERVESSGISVFFNAYLKITAMSEKPHDLPAVI